MSGRYVIAGTFVAGVAGRWYDQLAEAIGAEAVLTLPGAGLIPIGLSVRHIAERVGPGAVLVGHSQGGTVAALVDGTSAAVTLGAPVAWPWPVPAQDRPLLCVASRSDRVIPASIASVRHGETFTVDRPGHIDLVRSRRVIDHIASWLDSVEHRSRTCVA